ncbi:hypothetical protein QQF64_012550 [Cirrhinus molitorella]|uniref:Uncharacterized protein n=1 Tax=Cirrhinus molitorella TaxID=172907 RepID=A0ABR3LXI1_9TELE
MLNGAHTDCTLLINGCKQTRRLLRPAYLSRQSDDRGVRKRLWSPLYVHVSISLPSCLFCVDTHTMEEGEVSKENDMQAGTRSVRKCHCRLGVSRSQRSGIEGASEMHQGKKTVKAVTFIMSEDYAEHSKPSRLRLDK